MRKTDILILSLLLLLLFPTNSISNTVLNSELTDPKLNTESSNSSIALSIPRIRLLLFDKPTFVSGSSSADDLLRINFVSGGNNAVDFNDAPKFTNPDENIARNVNGTPISIEERDLPQINETLPLYSFGYATTDYVFVLTVLNMQFYNVFLYDNFTNTSYLLDKNAQTIVNFSVDSNVSGSTSINRFEFRFNSAECDPTLSGNIDSDTDNISDFCDLDDDNDGILDLTEIPSEPWADRDNDGVLVFLDDNDNDENIGDVNNAIEPGYDTDEDGILDNLALDSDNDGCSDANEYYEDANADGNEDANDDSRFGISSTLAINDFGLVVGASYAGNGLSASKDSALSNACTFVQNQNGDWNNSLNWDKTEVPRANHSAIVASDIVSTITQNQTVRSLSLEQGTSTNVTTININDDFTLSVKGNITNNGKIAVESNQLLGNGKVILDGSEKQNLFGTGDYENLDINNNNGVDIENSDVSNPTAISGILNIETGTLNTNDNLLFSCNYGEVKAGQIAPIVGDIAGTVSAEQCLPGRRSFRLISGSTNAGSIHDEWQENPDSYTDNPRPGYGTHITGVVPDPNQNAVGQQNLDQTNGLDWQPSGNVSMFSFNENSQGWDNVLDTQGTNLNAGEPYLLMIRGSRAVDLTSNTSVTSDTKLESTGSIAKGNVLVNPGISNDEFALIGNPFQASVNLNEVIPGNGYTNFVTIFDPNLGGLSDTNSSSTSIGGRGGYVTVDVTTGNSSIASGITGITTSEANQFIQPQQAFFVQGVPAGDGTPGTLTFEESDKAVSETQTDVFDTSPQSRIFVNLFDEESLEGLSTPEDGLVIYFSTNSDNAVNANDAPKFFNQDEVIARNENNHLISFENRNMPQEDEVLELYVDQYRDTDYTLEVGIQELSEYNVYLYDNYTNSEITLVNDTSNTYAFSVDNSNPESIASDRFEIRFETSTLSTNEFDLKGISVYPNPASDILNINLGDNTGRFESLELFDINGRLIISNSLENQLMDIQLNVNSLSSGVYVLKVNSGNEQFSTKVIVD